MGHAEDQGQENDATDGADADEPAAKVEFK
jgi:hypothetical protein